MDPTVADLIGEAPRRDSRASHPFKRRVFNRCVQVESIQRDSITGRARPFATAHRQRRRAFHEERTKPFERPISAARDAMWLHERRRGITKANADDGEIRDGLIHRFANHGHERVLLYRLDDERRARGALSISGVGAEVQRFRVLVQVELTRRV